MRQLLRPVQGPLSLQVPGVHKIPCTCGANYVGQTGWSITIRCKEHQSHLRLGHIDKSALAKHGWTTGHTVLFEQTEILYKSDQWGPRTTRESLELSSSNRALNREESAVEQFLVTELKATKGLILEELGLINSGVNRNQKFRNTIKQMSKQLPCILMRASIDWLSKSLEVK